MDDNMPTCLVILSGGRSRRMGRDKAEITLHCERLIDRAVSRFKDKADHIFLSAPHDYGTGIANIPDDKHSADGPVGAIFTLAQRLPEICPEITEFITVPVDAPFAPENLVARLSADSSKHKACLISKSPERLQPAFAKWRCDIVDAARRSHDLEETPSMHWLARQCDAQIISWPDEQAFMNINTPQDLQAAENIFKRGIDK